MDFELKSKSRMQDKYSSLICHANRNSILDKSTNKEA